MTTLQEKLQKALDRTGEHTFEDMLRRVQEQRAFPFFHGESVIIAEVYPYLRHSEVNCWLGAGRLDEVLQALPLVEEWGRHLGAKYIRGSGRPGWIRVLDRYGFKKRDVIMVKEL